LYILIVLYLLDLGALDNRNRDEDTYICDCLFYSPWLGSWNKKTRLQTCCVVWLFENSIWNF